MGILLTHSSKAYIGPVFVFLKKKVHVFRNNNHAYMRKLLPGFVLRTKVSALLLQNFKRLQLKQERKAKVFFIAKRYIGTHTISKVKRSQFFSLFA